MRTRADDSSVTVEIIDDGIGMDSGLVRHAFELFSQAEVTSDRSSGGLGLGLALVKSLVELHGGTVQCRSVGIGLGSTFTMRLYTRDSNHADCSGRTRYEVAAKSRKLVSRPIRPKRAYEERQQLFSQGLRCIGLWHTHPEPHPKPSKDDKQLARNYAAAASQQVHGIVFVIVGTQPHPNGFRVWVDDGGELRNAVVAVGRARPCSCISA